MTSNLAGIFTGSIRTQAHEKFWRKRSVSVSRECRDGPNFFGVPPIISGMGKATNFKFGRCIQNVHANKNRLKFGRKGSVGVSRDFSFLSTPYYLRNAQSYELQIWRVYSQGPTEQKPLKYLGEKAAWAYPGTSQIFWVPPIISGTGKATNFEFGTYIHRVQLSKSP